MVLDRFRGDDTDEPETFEEQYATLHMGAGQVADVELDETEVDDYTDQVQDDFSYELGDVQYSAGCELTEVLNTVYDNLVAHTGEKRSMHQRALHRAGATLGAAVAQAVEQAETDELDRDNSRLATDEYAEEALRANEIDGQAANRHERANVSDFRQGYKLGARAHENDDLDQLLS
jgi:hypothetical protein